MKDEETKPSRRKSGRFLGLALKAFSKDTSEKSEDDDKTTLLSRFGSRRSSKKKKKETVKSAHSLASINSRRPDVNKSKSCTVAEKNASSLEGEDDWQKGGRKASGNKQQNKIKPKQSKLKRSLSSLCGTNRSQMVAMKVAEVTKVKSRRSLGASTMNAVIRESRSRLINGLEIEGQDQKKSSKENLNESLPSGVTRRKSVKMEADSLCRRSLDFLSLSTKKNVRPKRQSYEQMNKERDCISPDTVSSDVTTTEKAAGKLSSFHLTTDNQKAPQQNEGNHDDTTRQQAQRHKSFGFSTPRGRERRCSGVYTTTATPTFMTCGFIMTDSPPDGVPDPRQPDHTRTNHQDCSSQSPATQPDLSSSQYNSSDLPWVAMKRKRHSELIDRSVVNRCNAGHTPLPPRKKCKSSNERLIN